MKNQGGNRLGGSGKFLEEVGFQKDRWTGYGRVEGDPPGL